MATTSLLLGSLPATGQHSYIIFYQKPNLFLLILFHLGNKTRSFFLFVPILCGLLSVVV